VARLSDLKPKPDKAQYKTFKDYEPGAKVDALCRELGISADTFYNWRSKYARLEVNEAKRLRALEAENNKLKRLLADKLLEVEAMQDVLEPRYPLEGWNAFVESLNGKFRSECLNQHWFRTLTEARWEIDQWRQHYNHVRPHSSLGYLLPVEFARRAA